MTSQSQTSGKRFPHIVLIRAPGLLPKQYKARELAEELGIHSRTLRDWLNQVVPYLRKGNLEILFWVRGGDRISNIG